MESVDFDQRQGRRNFSTAGVAALRRGSKNSENEVFEQKMRFPFGHYYSHMMVRASTEARSRVFIFNSSPRKGSSMAH